MQQKTILILFSLVLTAAADQVIIQTPYKYSSNSSDPTAIEEACGSGFCVGSKGTCGTWAGIKDTCCGYVDQSSANITTCERASSYLSTFSLDSTGTEAVKAEDCPSSTIVKNYGSYDNTTKKICCPQNDDLVYEIKTVNLEDYFNGNATAGLYSEILRARCVPPLSGSTKATGAASSNRGSSVFGWIFFFVMVAIYV